jgi:DNA repair protein RadC
LIGKSFQIKNNVGIITKKTTMKQTIKLYELKKIQSEFPKKKINSSKDAADFIRQFYQDDIEIFESSFILLLNQSNTTVGYAKISQGGITGTVVDPRIVAKYAVESLSPYVILAHNHPSGNLKASEADKTITDKIKNGLKLLDIKLLDHIILTRESYYSLADEGDM